MFSYLPGMSPFRSKVDISHFQIPTIIITPPEPTPPSMRTTSVSSQRNYFISATEKVPDLERLCIHVPPNHHISSMPMPQLLKPARPVRPLIVATVIRTEFAPHNQMLSTQSHIRVILNSSLRGQTRHSPFNSTLKEDSIQVQDEHLKLDFENYVMSIYGDQWSRGTPASAPSIMSSTLKDAEENDGNSAVSTTTSDHRARSNDVGCCYDFSDDDDIVVFTTPVYDVPSSPSTHAIVISSDRWEPKTIVIDIEKASKPPSSISPFRYCAIMMNAEMRAVANGVTVVSNEDELEDGGDY